MWYTVVCWVIIILAVAGIILEIIDGGDDNNVEM